MSGPILGEAIAVGPEDRLVVVLPKGTTLAELDEASVLLRQRHGDRVTVIAGVEQIAVLQNVREGICGDESPDYGINCTGTLRAICHLRYGHGSAWHESETGQRWKYAADSAPPVTPVERGGSAPPR